MAQMHGKKEDPIMLEEEQEEFFLIRTTLAITQYTLVE